MPLAVTDGNPMADCELMQTSNGPCGMLSMLLSGGWGVVPCRCRAGGDDAGTSRGRRGECVASGRLEPTVGLGDQSPSEWLRACRLRLTERAHVIWVQLDSVCVAEQLTTTHSRLPGAFCLVRRGNAGGVGMDPIERSVALDAHSTTSWWPRSMPPSRSSSPRAN
jgi:hypothetical protein